MAIQIQYRRGSASQWSTTNPILAILLLLAFTLVVIQLWRVGLKHIKKHYQKDLEDSSNVMNQNNAD